MIARLDARRLERSAGPGPQAALVAALVLLAGAPAGLAQSGSDSPPAGDADPGFLGRLGQVFGGESGTPTGDQDSPLPPNGTGVRVDDHQMVDLHVSDEDLANVLQMLSIQSRRNIVTSRNVSATVTANLYGVTFYEALDAILHVNGYGYMEKGNFIYVYTLDELEAIEQESRVRVSKVINLNFLNAIDAAEFVKPLLSEGGQIKTPGKSAAFGIPDNAPVGADDYALGATLVIVDYPENIEEIEALLAQIDTRPAQVLVEATILQAQLNEANAFGIDFSIIGDLDFTDFSNAGGPVEAVDSLIRGNSDRVGVGTVEVPGTDGEGRGVVSTPGNTAGPATFKLGIVDGDFAMFLRALDEVTDTTIVSNPKILALNRQPSRVLVGTKVGYLNTTTTDTATTQTVEFLDTGTQLYFRPFVSSDGLIRMELKPQVSTALIRDARDASGATVTIPDEDTSEIVTNVMVRDGQTIVLGGLFRESTVSARRQVPGLGNIPIIGAAFRGHDDEVKRTEIIFMIRPTIMSDKILLDQGERALAHAERTRVGSRNGLLIFSRDRRTAQLNVEAERLANQGKSSAAIHKLRQSLRLNKHQPEAIAMLEALTKKQRPWHERSALEEVIRGEAAARNAQWGASSHAHPAGTATDSTQLSSYSATDESAAFDDSTSSTPADTAGTLDGTPDATPTDTSTSDDTFNDTTGSPQPADSSEPANHSDTTGHDADFPPSDTGGSHEPTDLPPDSTEPTPDSTGDAQDSTEPADESAPDR